MKELALHILDLIQNSITAKATHIDLIIDENRTSNKLTIKIVDNGCGMSADTLNKVIDPFYTTRTTRSVGLGIPMFKVNAEMCGGHFGIGSEVGKGTWVEAAFQFDHIDRPPLGNMAATLMGIVLSLEDCDLTYTHYINANPFVLSTQEMRDLLGEGVSLSDLEVLQWVRGYVEEGLAEIEALTN